jgi:hypothetical protein
LRVIREVGIFLFNAVVAEKAKDFVATDKNQMDTD